ncbi:twin-arginine translocase TatA/TatE family subunit [uncultured Paraglaciecola sp.]|uniref:twin-arginine translocase TatA/TatE family subunit n=1 Tax=uncultured Paraglaciecola sp. TaxID=1765024 RepID=UPI0030DA8C3C|tara:strand:+ start:19287 stop:19514 length:228 start_codon:yes stop_codon:yes gene_type:complete
MSLSIWQILLVALLFILLFGRGKIPALMTDLAAGIKNFKHGMKEQEEDEHAAIATKSATQNTTTSAETAKSASQS